MRRGLIVAGLAALLIGGVLGFMPQSAQGSDCGSVFVGGDDAQVDDLTDSLTGLGGGTSAADACDDRRGLYRPVVWTLLIVGGLAAVTGLMVGDGVREGRTGGGAPWA